MPILAMLAAAALSTPTPGVIKTFGDWDVGCDNGLVCQAVSLMPETATDADVYVPMVATIGPGPKPDVSVQFPVDPLPKGQVTVFIDGQPVAAATPSSGSLYVNDALAISVLTAMANAKSFELRAGAKRLGKVSVAGSSATLRYVDATQRRAGTATGFVAQGNAAPTSVPTPPLPVVRQAALAKRSVVAPAGQAALPLRTLAKCTDEFSGTDQPLEAYPLDAQATLILVPCGAGAYNANSVPLVQTAGKTALAPFDFAPVALGESGGPPMLVNASWDKDTGALWSYAKGRGVGDCGNSQRYVWDGQRFRLIEATQLDACRGGGAWITTWRASVTQR